MNNGVNDITDDLRTLYKDDPSAKRLFGWFDARKKDSWQMPVRIAAYRTGLTEGEVRRIFSELETLGCGSVIKGRKGYETRMAWDLSIKSIAAAAKGAADKLDDVSVAPGEALEDEEPNLNQVGSESEGQENGVVHTFKLRPDFEVNITLPMDFNSKEAERLAGYLKVIPVD